MTRGWQDAARIVFPRVQGGADLSILALYALDWTPYMQKGELFDLPASLRPHDRKSAQDFREDQTIQSPSFNAFEVKGRREAEVLSGSAMSLCSYFNAFPAGFWARFTDVKTVKLAAKVEGDGVLECWRSDAAGRCWREKRIAFDGGLNLDEPFDISGMSEGGYLWLDLHAASDCLFSAASWRVPPARECGQTACVSTFNSPLSAAKAISSLRGKSLKSVICVDQGSESAGLNPEFLRAAGKAPGFKLVRQENLGGAGGFARGMVEAEKTGAENFILMDDDAVMEGETLDRIAAFQDRCPRPVIVGSGMLHADSPSSLFTFGEVMDWDKLWYKTALDLGYSHDFAALPLRDCPRLHRRAQEDYNGWWLCSIPKSVKKAIGLPLPIFIKFDDIEYGIRAKEAGIPSVCLPGTGVWHPAWHLKDQSRSWTCYFVERNRFLLALLYSRPAVSVLKASLRDQCNLGIRMEYGSMALMNLALKDLLRGPSCILASQEKKKQEAMRLKMSFDLPELSPSKLPLPSAQVPDAEGISRLRRAGMAAKAIAFSAFGPAHGATEREVSSRDSWVSLAFCSSAMAYGHSGKAKILKKDAPLFRKLCSENALLAFKLMCGWDSLSHSYSRLLNPSCWDSIFERP